MDEQAIDGQFDWAHASRCDRAGATEPLLQLDLDVLWILADGWSTAPRAHRLHHHRTSRAADGVPRLRCTDALFPGCAPTAAGEGKSETVFNGAAGFKREMYHFATLRAVQKSSEDVFFD